MKSTYVDSNPRVVIDTSTASTAAVVDVTMKRLNYVLGKLSDIGSAYVRLAYSVLVRQPYVDITKLKDSEEVKAALLDRETVLLADINSTLKDRNAAHIVSKSKLRKKLESEAAQRLRDEEKHARNKELIVALSAIFERPILKASNQVLDSEIIAIAKAKKENSLNPLLPRYKGTAVLVTDEFENGIMFEAAKWAYAQGIKGQEKARQRIEDKKLVKQAELWCQWIDKKIEREKTRKAAEPPTPNRHARPRLVRSVSKSRKAS